MKPDRKESTLAAYFTSLTEPERTAIQAIALDMWDPYIKAIQTHCPHGAIVFDFFYVVRNFQQVTVCHGIINHCLFPIHTSKLEEITNNIKVIKRKAYGFLDLEYFILKVKFATFTCN